MDDLEGFSNLLDLFVDTSGDVGKALKFFGLVLFGFGLDLLDVLP